MRYESAVKIATQLQALLEPACEPGYCRIAGGIARHKDDPHDIELVVKPILKAPVPVFGQKIIHKTIFDEALFRLEQDGWLKTASRNPLNGDKLKKREVVLEKFCVDLSGVVLLDPFCVDIFLVTPPAQFGVQMMIRTGPGGKGSWSQWIVTPRWKGGALPDGYRVQAGAVWEGEIEAKESELDPSKAIQMPTEQDFFDFMNIKYMEPWDRIPRWRHRG